MSIESRHNACLPDIIEKVLEREPLSNHERAVLSYLGLVLSDFELNTNGQLETTLQWSRQNGK